MVNAITSNTHLKEDILRKDKDRRSNARKLRRRKRLKWI
jgi:hypothetical protein